MDTCERCGKKLEGGDLLLTGTDENEEFTYEPKYVVWVAGTPSFCLCHFCFYKVLSFAK